jgi:hypothetical protein
MPIVSIDNTKSGMADILHVLPKGELFAWAIGEFVEPVIDPEGECAPPRSVIARVPELFHISSGERSQPAVDIV